MLRKLLLLSAAILVLAVGGGMLLPSQWETSRAVLVRGTARDIHGWIADRGRWPRWCPSGSLLPAAAGRPPAVRVTSRNPGRGVWYDFRDADLGAGKGVFLYDGAPEGTRVTATVRWSLGGDPWTRWSRWFAARSRAKMLEKQLAALRALVEGPEGEAPEAAAAPRAATSPQNDARSPGHDARSAKNVPGRQEDDG